MLKRAVQEAIEGSRSEKEDEDNILGVGVELDEEIVKNIKDGLKKVPEVEIEEEEVEETRAIYWVPLLQTVLWAYRSTPHTVTGYSPAMLVLGNELQMPFDKLMEVEQYPNTAENHTEQILRRIKWLMEGIPGLRQIKEPGEEVSKVWTFELGQRVWKRESKYDGKGFAPVFAPRWTGPFVIHSVWGKNVHKLRTDRAITGTNQWSWRQAVIQTK